MNQNNNLGRWTKPTSEKERAFYARNVHAIARYTWATWAIQIILAALAYTPVCMLLSQVFHYVPSLSPAIPYLAVGLLLLLHYVLHEEILEALSNWRDNDDETNNKWHNYVVPMLIAFTMVAADIAGARYTVYKLAHKDTSELAKNELNAAKQQLQSKYESDVADTKRDFEDKITATRAPFDAQIDKIKRRKVYDKFDRDKRNADVRAKQAERDNAIATLVSEKADALTAIRFERDRAIAKAENRRDKTDSDNEASDAEAKALAHDSSWAITVVCWFIFGFMSFRLVELRVKAGIRKNISMTDLDATGSFWEKFWAATQNVLQRQGHRFLVWYHRKASSGTSVLHDFDGRVVLKQSYYNSVFDSPNDPNNGNTEGGNGGGGSNPTAPTPPPAPPHGATKPQKAEPPADVAVMDIPNGVIVEAKNELYGDTPISALTDEQKVELMKLASAYWNVENQKPVITGSETVITKEAEADIAMIVSHIRRAIQDLNADCSNYETKNGRPETVIERIRTKRDALVVIFHKNSGAISPQYPEMVESYEKAIARAGKILNDYFNTKRFRSEL